MKRIVWLAALALTLGVIGPRVAPAAENAPALAWPGELEGPKSIYVSIGYGQLVGTFGTEVWLVRVADEEMPRVTKTDEPININTVGGSTLQAGQATVTTTRSIHAGHVSVDVAVVANVAYTKASDGKAYGSQRSTASAHFDVSPCPEVSGVAGGQISVRLHEDTTFPDGSISSSTSTAEGPFRIINGDDARRVRTEIDLQVTNNSTHTAPLGSGTDPVGWGVTAPLSEVKGVEGSFAPNELDPSKVWSLGEVPKDAWAYAPASEMVHLTMLQLEEEVENFWRSGKCIKLIPDPGSRKVSPGEKVSLTVKAEQHFDQKEVKAPIKAELTGVKSVEPRDKPVDEPAKFDFTAGEKKDEVGKIQLTQTGKRGIGKVSVTYTVDPPAMVIAYSGSWVCGEVGHGNWHEVQLALVPTRLEGGVDGVYRGIGNMTAKGKWFSSPHGCKADVDVADAMKIVATLDKTDPTLVHLQISPPNAPNPSTHKLNITCAVINPGMQSVYFPIEWFGRLVSNQTVPIGKPTVIAVSRPTSLAENKTSIKFTLTIPEQ